MKLDYKYIKCCQRRPVDGSCGQTQMQPNKDTNSTTNLPNGHFNHSILIQINTENLLIQSKLNVCIYRENTDILNFHCNVYLIV